MRGNALEPRTYEHHLQGALAAISAVGAFGSQAEMLKVRYYACIAVQGSLTRIPQACTSVTHVGFSISNNCFKSITNLKRVCR